MKIKRLSENQHREFSANGAERRLHGSEDFTMSDARAMREIFALVPANEKGANGENKYSPRLTSLLDRQLDIAAHIEGML